ncbi:MULTISPECIES: nucleoside-diphosphate sugar epimerase/dehydratase [unclassified Sphingopyxis]|uniref:polysaccharide biosynthesis protein n=1 Tax=unclassified Sphingopyxis TaxID=2614943 RepID=UPI0024AE2855|nr:MULTISPECIES: nucleoside-diphosphate sugar epimerase/dehydratase [unclassified Sphingopyxis]
MDIWDGQALALRERAMAQAVHWLAWLADLPRRRRQQVAIMMDAVLCVVAVWIALSLRVGEWNLFTRPVFILSAVAIILWFPIALRWGIYLSIIRFSGGRTMMGLAVASALFAIPMVLIFMVVGIAGVPRTMGLLHPIIFLALLSVSRLTIRFALVDILHRANGGRELRRVLIYGAGRAGQQLSLSLRHEPHVQVLGYVDDDVRLNGQRLDGIPIYSSDRLAWAIRTLMIDEVLIGLPRISRARRREIIDALQNFQVQVRVLPSLSRIMDGEVSINDLRAVQIEDLLGRDPVAPNALLMGRNIVGKTVLVSGAGGSIGSELCRQILSFRPHRLILVDQSEYALYAIDDELTAAAAQIDGSAIAIVPELGNVADRDSISRIYSRWRPDTVFHAAAYKHVPLVETNPVAGMRNNIFGTLFSCLAAEEVGVATFILISTDKAVRPTNIMGASKRVCELILQARSAKRRSTVFTMVRFGNVLGSSGSVVPRFMAQIRAGGPVTLTHRDVTRYFMTIPEAAQLVIQAGAMAKGGEVFVLDMGQPVRIRDLAASMIRLSGLSVRDDTHPDGDIEIREIGMRPGEKLYEELLIGEDPQSTMHERIIRASETMLDWDDLARALDGLAGHLARGEADEALQILRALVPEYAPPVDHSVIQAAG